MFIYLASSSQGDRERLRGMQGLLSLDGFLSFAPCLGFAGDNRRGTMDGERIVAVDQLALELSDAVVLFDEQKYSPGGWREVERAMQLLKPVAVFDVNGGTVSAFTGDVPVFHSFNDLEKWLNGL